ncbi:MAG: indolepyruvate ferredoxin oxidoreductase subunit alpha [bacterium]
MTAKSISVQLTIDKDWCKGCQLCINTCPNHLLSLSEDLNSSGFHYAALLQPDQCTGCGLCAQMCPDMAIQIWISE